MLPRLLKTYRLTLLVALLAVGAWAFPTAVPWMELNFRLVADGQWWRIWTGHVTHYDGNHLFWDLLMFTVLAAACERANRRWFPVALLSMTAGITAILGFYCRDIHVYRGLSGIDTGLFVWLLAEQIRRCWSARHRLSACIWSVGVVGLLGKLGFEAATGQTLFVDSSSFTPLVEAHLAGALLGLLCSWGSSLGFISRPDDARCDASESRIASPIAPSIDR
jgi:rhomboid family GlyGly-CTERM serine protease